MKYLYRTIRAPMGAWQIQEVESGKILVTRATRREIREAMAEIWFKDRQAKAEEANAAPAP